MKPAMVSAVNAHTVHSCRRPDSCPDPAVAGRTFLLEPGGIGHAPPRNDKDKDEDDKRDRKEGKSPAVGPPGSQREDEEERAGDCPDLVERFVQAEPPSPPDRRGDMREHGVLCR